VLGFFFFFIQACDNRVPWSAWSVKCRLQIMFRLCEGMAT
jgi:hypothetical protein